ncbi:MAG: LON peptidase substrate-binding domain-containing protein [Pyrinomonadaceae bacterium]
MSDALDRVRGISHLPLFPLPLVMLPNELLPLHIFEERYRQMLRDIEATGKLFGVTLFESPEPLTEKPPTGSIGCVAEIRESELLEDGRSNILALGLVRYRLIGYADLDEPYLVAAVEFFDDDPEDPETIDPLADEVFALFERMAKAAFKMSGSRGQLPEIQRTDPESLSFLITAAFNFDNDKKYQLLEMTSTTGRLRDLKQILQKTVVQIENSADIQAVAKSNGHSNKKIDL